MATSTHLTRTMPAQGNRPASPFVPSRPQVARSGQASSNNTGGDGSAMTLYPTAQARFWRTLRHVPWPMRICDRDVECVAAHRTTSAVSTATSVPAPIAIPRLAHASAGAALTPSPTNGHLATVAPQLGDLHGLGGQHLMLRPEIAAITIAGSSLIVAVNPFVPQTFAPPRWAVLR
jgi:hypothetical protein